MTTSEIEAIFAVESPMCCDPESEDELLEGLNILARYNLHAEGCGHGVVYMKHNLWGIASRVSRKDINRLHQIGWYEDSHYNAMAYCL